MPPSSWSCHRHPQLAPFKNLKGHFCLFTLHFSGIEILHTPKGMHLSKAAYLSQVPSKLGFTDCKSSPTLIITKSPHGFTSLKFSDPSLFRSLLGSLYYSTMTQLHISYVVNQVCQAMQSPTEVDFTVVKRLLWYLKGLLTKWTASQLQVPTSFLVIIPSCGQPKVYR